MYKLVLKAYGEILSQNMSEPEEISQSRKTNIVGFLLHKVPRVVNVIETGSRTVVTGAGRWGRGLV